MTAAIFFEGDGLVQLCWVGPLLYSRTGVLFVSRVGVIAGACCYLAAAQLPGARLLRRHQVANGLVRLSVGAGRGHSCILRIVAGN